ncbi:MAG: hypothetical protein AAF492_30865, partial [Verrucomicrobiota bacterium]
LRGKPEYPSNTINGTWELAGEGVVLDRHHLAIFVDTGFEGLPSSVSDRVERRYYAVGDATIDRDHDAIPDSHELFLYNTDPENAGSAPPRSCALIAQALQSLSLSIDDSDNCGGSSGPQAVAVYFPVGEITECACEIEIELEAHVEHLRPDFDYVYWNDEVVIESVDNPALWNSTFPGFDGICNTLPQSTVVTQVVTGGETLTLRYDTRDNMVHAASLANVVSASVLRIVAPLNISPTNSFLRGADSTNLVALSLVSNQTTNVTWTIEPSISNGAKFVHGTNICCSMTSGVNSVTIAPGSAGTQYVIRVTSDELPSCQATAGLAVVTLDVDVDSDNNNGFDLPDRTAGEDRIEDILGINASSSNTT